MKLLLLLLLAAVALSAQTPHFFGVLIYPPVTAGSSNRMVSCMVDLTGTGASVATINGHAVLTIPARVPVPLSQLPCVQPKDLMVTILLKPPRL